MQYEYKQEYGEILQVISKWLPRDYRHTDNDINNFLSDTLNMDFSPYIDAFMERIDAVDYEFSDNSLVSGFVCFIGSVLMSLLQEGEVYKINDLFTFASCYMLMDHYLDDKDIDKQSKSKLISEIASLMILKDESKITSPIIQLVAKKYLTMIKNNPQAKIQFSRLFKAEVKCFRLQSKDNLSEKEYMKIAEWKGGATCTTIQSLLELPITDHELILGAVIQLVDDMIDLDEDLNSGIHTIATFHIKEYKTLEKLFIETIKRIGNMSPKYNFFKPVLVLGAMFGIYNHSEWVSKDILIAIDPYIPYKPSTTKEKMKSRFIRLLKERSSVYNNAI